ncbi:MAG: hypothetical protein Q8O56_06275 [Solirubrobacteraceae bacterium]|nr:hypothetical protein [Solirubrobacteraceae bacterium]
MTVIEVVFEAALDHIFAGGRGNADHPYLPAFETPRSPWPPR